QNVPKVSQNVPSVKNLGIAHQAPGPGSARKCPLFTSTHQFLSVGEQSAMWPVFRDLDCYENALARTQAPAPARALAPLNAPPSAPPHAPPHNPLKVPPHAPLSAFLAQVVRRRGAHSRNFLADTDVTADANSPSKRALSGFERIFSLTHLLTHLLTRALTH